MQQDPLEREEDQLATRLWQELSRAPHDRHHDWRTPTLSTQGLGQTGPQARTVVLRHADVSLWSLMVYTDSRSPKCAELLAQPLAQFTFWSKRLNWQLRVSTQASVDLDGEQVRAAWEKVKATRAASDYLSELPPGQIQSSSKTLVEMSEDAVSHHHLAVLSFKVTSMDWLALRKDGHRRARLKPNGSLEWLVP